MSTLSTKDRDESWFNEELSFSATGMIYARIGLELAKGERDENKLTNIGFFTLHPERNGAPLKKSEPDFDTLSAEWLEIRNTIVKPLLAKLAAGSRSIPRGQSCVLSTRDHLERLLREAEERGAPAGFATFAIAAAWTESRWNNCARNSSPSEAKAALNGFRGARERGWFRDNQYDEADFGFGTGGWFGLMPSSALTAGGKDGPFVNGHPGLIFDPAASVVMLADMVIRIVRRYEARDWLAVRRGMKSVALVRDTTDSRASSGGVRQRFYDALSKIGVSDPSLFAGKPVVIGSYPGAAALYAALRDIT